LDHRSNDPKFLFTLRIELRCVIEPLIISDYSSLKIILIYLISDSISKPKPSVDLNYILTFQSALISYQIDFWMIFYPDHQKPSVIHISIIRAHSPISYNYFWCNFPRLWHLIKHIQLFLRLSLKNVQANSFPSKNLRTSWIRKYYKMIKTFSNSKKCPIPICGAQLIKILSKISWRKTTVFLVITWFYNSIKWNHAGKNRKQKLVSS